MYVCVHNWSLLLELKFRHLPALFAVVVQQHGIGGSLDH